jgi:uncharacterized membrane protein (TIGR02234 family)
MTATSTAPPATSPSRFNGTREKIVAALLAAAGAGLILASDGRGWATATVTAPVRLSVQTSGSNLTSLPYALGLAGLAGAVALFAVRRIGRYLVGAVLLGAGAGTVVAVATNLGRLDSAQLARTAEQTLGASAAQLGPVSNTAWPYVTLAGGVLVAFAGALTLVRGRSWTGLSNRYERNTSAAASAPSPAADEQSARDLWDAINRGTDPTA